MATKKISAAMLARLVEERLAQKQSEEEVVVDLINPKADGGDPIPMEAEPPKMIVPEIAPEQINPQAIIEEKIRAPEYQDISTQNTPQISAQHPAIAMQASFPPRGPIGPFGPQMHHNMTHAYSTNTQIPHRPATNHPAARIQQNLQDTPQYAPPQNHQMHQIQSPQTYRQQAHIPQHHPQVHNPQPHHPQMHNPQLNHPSVQREVDNLYMQNRQTGNISFNQGTAMIRQIQNQQMVNQQNQSNAPRPPESPHQSAQYLRRWPEIR